MKYVTATSRCWATIVLRYLIIIGWKLWLMRHSDDVNRSCLHVSQNEPLVTNQGNNSPRKKTIYLNIRNPSFKNFKVFDSSTSWSPKTQQGSSYEIIQVKVILAVMKIIIQKIALKTARTQSLGLNIWYFLFIRRNYNTHLKIWN